MHTVDLLGTAPVSAFMTHPVVTIEGNACCDVAEASMEEHGIRHLPVVDAEGRLMGVVGRHDLMRPGYGERGREKLLHSLPVKEVMRETTITIGPDQPAWEAARLLLDHRIGCLPVLEDGRLVGIVTSTDLLRLLSISTCTFSMGRGR